MQSVIKSLWTVVLLHWKLIYEMQLFDRSEYSRMFAQCKCCNNSCKLHTQITCGCLWISLTVTPRHNLIFTDHSHAAGPHFDSCRNTYAHIQICIIADSGSAWSETTAGRCYCETDSESLACMNIPTHGWQSWKQYPTQNTMETVPTYAPIHVSHANVSKKSASRQCCLYLSSKMRYFSTFLIKACNSFWCDRQIAQNF